MSLAGGSPMITRMVGVDFARRRLVQSFRPIDLRVSDDLAWVPALIPGLCSPLGLRSPADKLPHVRMAHQPAHHPQGRRLTGQCATACAHPVCCRIPGLTHDSLSRLACGCPSPRAASPTIGKAEAYPSSIAVSCCAWALHSGGDPRLQLSALCFMQECETAFTVRCGRKNLSSLLVIRDQLALAAFSGTSSRRARLGSSPIPTSRLVHRAERHACTPYRTRFGVVCLTAPRCTRGRPKPSPSWVLSPSAIAMNCARSRCGLHCLQVVKYRPWVTHRAKQIVPNR